MYVNSNNITIKGLLEKGKNFGDYAILPLAFIVYGRVLLLYIFIQIKLNGSR